MTAPTGGGRAAPRSPGESAGPIVCHCFRLTLGGLRRLLHAHRCTTVEEVAERTGACRGCQTCRPEIEALLAEGPARSGEG